MRLVVAFFVSVTMKWAVRFTLTVLHIVGSDGNDYVRMMYFTELSENLL